MTLHHQRLADYLGHILGAIERIHEYTLGMEESEFVSSTLVQDAVIRNLEVVGEASNNVIKKHAQFAQSHPELPLSFAYQMRNAISHGYFKVDVAVVWQTIKRDLPDLHAKVSHALGQLNDEPY